VKSFGMNRNILDSASNAVELSGYHLFQVLQFIAKSTSRNERGFDERSWMYRVVDYIREFGRHQMNKLSTLIPIKVVSIKADMEKDAKIKEMEEEIRKLKALHTFEPIHVKETSFHLQLELDDNNEVSRLSIQFHDVPPTPPPTPPNMVGQEHEHEQRYFHKKISQFSLSLSPIAHNKPKDQFPDHLNDSANKLFTTPAKQLTGRGMLMTEILSCARELRKGKLESTC
jgi:hypothetical protein